MNSSGSKECSSKESSLDQIDLKENSFGQRIRSINLPWYGSSMFRHEIVDVKIKDYWLYIFTKQSFEIFVFDVHRIAFLETKNPQMQFEEALVQFYLDHISKDLLKEQKYRLLGNGYNSDEDEDLFE